ncbi:ABC transporter substrate-binding protein [Marinobacter daqiaonensis]|nr:ABC transporter substrate-binding protein [Marinobacter daqiaonensis]
MVNLATIYYGIDAVTWDTSKWNWKANHDMLFMDHLIMGDLDYGPSGKNVNDFIAQAFIPPEHYKGDLAESWEVKEDPLRIEFKLRENVYWMAKDGVMDRREFVAQDVVEHFEAMKSSDRYIPTYWDFIEEWKAEGDHTAVAYLNEFNANWGYRIAWGYYNGIMPPEWHALSGEDKADWKKATGTGPYELTEVARGQRQVYKANEEYWDTTTIEGKTYELPLNDGVVYNIIKDESSSIAALRSGKLDIHESIRWQFVDELKKTAPDLNFKSALKTEGTFIALRTDKKPFNDVRVRRAMNLAVDQRAIQQSLLNGEGALLNYPFSQRWTSLYTPIEELDPQAQAMFEHQPEKAKELLAEAGYPNGFEFDLQVCSCDPYHTDMVAMLQAYYQMVGVEMNIKTLEYGAFRSQMRDENQAEGYLMDNGEGNPFSVLRKSFVSGQTWNPAFYSDEKFDSMWKTALHETDVDKQNEMLRDMNEYIIEEAVPQVWLPTQEFYIAWWPWVKNYDGELRVGAVRPGPIYARIWLDQELKEEMGY